MPVPTVVTVAISALRLCSKQLFPSHFRGSVLVGAVVKSLVSLRFDPFLTASVPSKIKVISVPAVTPVPEIDVMLVVPVTWNEFPLGVMIDPLATAVPNRVHDKPFSRMPATGAPSRIPLPDEPDLPIQNSIAPGVPLPVGRPPCICIGVPFLFVPHGVGLPSIPPVSSTARDIELFDSGSLLPPIHMSVADVPPPAWPALQTIG